MSQKNGWIKQYRANLMQFSKDPLLNISLFNLFTYLLSNAVWEDFNDLKRGQVKAKTSDIQKWMPYVNSAYVRKLTRILIEKNYIMKVKYCKNELDYSVFEICNYDAFSGANECEHAKKMRTSTELAPNERQNDKQLELLENNHANLTCCNSTELAPNEQGVFLFIEERNKEEKEELNTLPEHATHVGESDVEIIIDEPIKKTKKPGKKSEGKSIPVINAYKEAYLARYKVDPLINVKVRSQACKIAEQIASESIENFIWFYLSHNDPYYVKNLHSLGILLAQIEKIHTEFQKGDYVTQDYVNSFSQSRNKSRFRI